MSDGIWGPDWDDQLQARLARLGYASVSDFVESHPDQTFYELGEHLGDEFAPIHLITYLRQDAERSGTLPEFAKLAFVHAMRINLPDGWSEDEANAFARSGVLSNWLAWVGEASEPRLRLAWERLKKDLRPHQGWTPQSTRDPYVERMMVSARL